MAGAVLPEVNLSLIAGVDAAVARGVFSSPSFFVCNGPYFDKDQLRGVEDEIERCRCADG